MASKSVRRNFPVRKTRKYSRLAPLNIDIRKNMAYLGDCKFQFGWTITWEGDGCQKIWSSRQGLHQG